MLCLLKLGILFSLLYSGSLAQINIHCDECIEFVQGNANVFVQDEYIEYIENHLKTDICANDFEDVGACVQGVEEWTKPMIKAAMEAPDFGIRFCYHYGICRNELVSFGILYRFPDLNCPLNRFSRKVTYLSAKNVLQTTKFWQFS